MRKIIFKYSIELIVIIVSILISFSLESARQSSIEKELKNKIITRLVSVINEDIKQIDGFIYLQNYSLNSCNKLFQNLSGDYNMSNDSIMYHISSVSRALRSFFPQGSVFNQLVSSDLIKMIESEELTRKLFKLYNEDLKRHDVHTKEFDNFFLKFNYSLSENYFLQDNWSNSPTDSNPIRIHSYRFNEEYYKSNRMFSDIIESKTSIIQYLQELNVLRKSFSTLKDLCVDELSIN
jgi:hypothetical protein|tara:strand:+ start:1013 stop:1720 length:708 start_codon:yes stop_codon:yes gene_type:complete